MSLSRGHTSASCYCYCCCYSASAITTQEMLFYTNSLTKTYIYMYTHMYICIHIYTYTYKYLCLLSYQKAVFGDILARKQETHLHPQPGIRHTLHSKANQLLNSKPSLCSHFPAQAYSHPSCTGETFCCLKPKPWTLDPKLCLFLLDGAGIVQAAVSRRCEALCACLWSSVCSVIGYNELNVYVGKQIERGLRISNSASIP